MSRATVHQDRQTTNDMLNGDRDPIGYLAHTIYTPLSLFFPWPDADEEANVVNKVENGLRRLSAAVPWLAGQVVRPDKAERPFIVPLDPNIRLIIKDYRQDESVPSMDALKSASFPSSLLDGAIFTSLHGAPNQFENGEIYPVFFAQATFIRGGFVLTLAGEHSVLDGQGLGTIIRLFDRACHGQDFMEEELYELNRPRATVVPLLDLATYKPGPELDPLLIPPPPQMSPTPPPQPECSWVYVHFSASSLRDIKSRALESATTSNISTNDAISAFIWQSVSRVRANRSPGAKTTTTFARAVDVRPSLSISPLNPSVLSSHTYSTRCLAEVVNAPLGVLASILREALNPQEVAYAMRSLVTYISSSPENMSKVRYGAKLDLSFDLFFSSWTRIPSQELDFGLGLGLPEAVRRPRFAPVQGLMYLMPMKRDGGVDAAICLSDQDLEALRKEDQFAQYGQWIG